jgi:hypothetical protein
VKPSLIQTAAPTTNGNISFTDASISSDLVAAMAFSNDATVNATVSTSGRFNWGAWDRNNPWSGGGGQTDNVAAGSATAGQIITPTYMWGRSASSGLQTVSGAPSALSNGVQLACNPTDGAAYLINMLMLAGADFAAGSATAAFATTDTSKTFAHNCGGTPGLLMFFIANRNATLGTNFVPLSWTVGLWDGTNSVGYGLGVLNTTNPTGICARITSDLGHWTFADIDVATWSVSNVGATNITVSRTATTSQAANVAVFALRGTTGTLTAKAIQATLPTSAGNFTPFSGMAAAPQVSLIFPTRLTSTALATDDTTGSFGLCAAVNNSGTTQQMSIASTVEDNVATTVAKAQNFNNKALAVLDNTGATQALGTVASWNSDGVTYNLSQAPASALEYIGIAFGVNTPVAAPYTPYTMTQWFVNDQYQQ